MRRMAIAIRSWQDCLVGVGDSAVDTMDTTSTPQLPHKLGGTPALQVSGKRHLREVFSSME